MAMESMNQEGETLIIQFYLNYSLDTVLGIESNKQIKQEHQRDCILFQTQSGQVMSQSHMYPSCPQLPPQHVLITLSNHDGWVRLCWQNHSDSPSASIDLKSGRAESGHFKLLRGAK